MNGTTILEIKEKYSGLQQAFKCRLLALNDDEAVVLYRLTADYQLHGISLSAGDISVGYFWPSRPYNVYHFLNPDGQTLAFYTNISDRTTISIDKIYWRDLIVDILTTPDGRCRVLDREELPADMDPTLLSYIENACEELLRASKTLQKEWARRTAAFIGSII